jgi:hypothetical protein
MGRNREPGCRDARHLRDEREFRSLRGSDRSDVGWPMKQSSMNEGRECLDQTRVPPALMLRQLAFAMRVSRALYAAAQLGIADLLAGGPMTSGQLCRRGRRCSGLRRLLRPRGLWCLRGDARIDTALTRRLQGETCPIAACGYYSRPAT